jgi:rhodanese-related sulfurtransferase
LVQLSTTDPSAHIQDTLDQLLLNLHASRIDPKGKEVVNEWTKTFLYTHIRMWARSNLASHQLCGGISMLERDIKKIDFIFHKPIRICAFILGAYVLLIAAMVPGVEAGGCGCAGGCSAAGNWELSANAFLNSDVPGAPSAPSNSTNNNSSANGTAPAATSNAKSAPKSEYRSDLFTNGQILKPLQSVASSDVVIDASNGDSYSKSHVKGAIHVPSGSFINDTGSLKSAQELAEILGDAGVSRDDPIVVYSDDFSSGDATFVFWTEILGTERCKVLDGSLKIGVHRVCQLSPPEHKACCNLYTKPEIGPSGQL